MMNKPIVLVVGARPNFVKASPLYSTMRERKIEFKGVNEDLRISLGISTISSGSKSL